MKFRLLRKSLPLGVRIISVIYYIATVLYLAASILAFSGSKLLTQAPGFTNTFSSHYSAFLFLGIVLFLLSGFSFLVAFGLQKKNNAARIALMAFCLLNIIGGIISITGGSYTSSVNLAFNLAVGIYLGFNRKVRKEFGKN